MKTELKDVLHFYLGQDVLAPSPEGCEPEDGEFSRGILTGIHGEFGAEIQFIIDGNVLEHPEYEEFNKCKLILRPLDDMTVEENEEWRAISNNKQTPTISQMAREVKWFLSKGFDLFNLIPNGLAIDKNSLL